MFTVNYNRTPIYHRQPGIKCQTLSRKIDVFNYEPRIVNFMELEVLAYNLKYVSEFKMVTEGETSHE